MQTLSRRLNRLPAVISGILLVILLTSTQAAAGRVERLNRGHLQELGYIGGKTGFLDAPIKADRQGSPTPEGFKLHISANPLAPEVILVPVLNKLLELGVPHKILLPTDYRDADFHEEDHPQHGKFITVYPQNKDELISVSSSLAALFQRLKNEDINLLHDKVNNDERLFPDYPVYMRYGGHIAEQLHVPPEDRGLTRREDFIDDNVLRFGRTAYFEMKMTELSEKYEALTGNELFTERESGFNSNGKLLDAGVKVRLIPVSNANREAVRGLGKIVEELKKLIKLDNVFDKPRAFPPWKESEFRDTKTRLGLLNEAIDGSRQPAQETTEHNDAQSRSLTNLLVSEENRGNQNARQVSETTSTTSARGNAEQMDTDQLKNAVLGDRSIPAQESPEGVSDAERIDRALQEGVRKADSNFVLGRDGVFERPHPAVLTALNILAERESGIPVPDEHFNIASEVWKAYKAANERARIASSPDKGKEKDRGKEKDKANDKDKGKEKARNQEK